MMPEGQVDNPGRKRCWPSVALGVVLAAIALAAMRIDLLNNYGYGAPISSQLAGVMVLAAIGVTALPAAAALKGWDWLLRGGTAACAVLTVWASVSAYAERQGQMLLHAQGQAATYEGSRADEGRLRGELTRISETSEAAALLALADAAAERAKAEVKTGKGDRYQAAIDEEARFRERAGQAKRRDELEAELRTAKAETQASGGPAEASMLATFIAHHTGHAAGEIARLIALATTGFAILVTIMMAGLANQAAQLIALGLGLRPVRTLVATPPATACNVATGPEGSRAKAKKSSRSYWMERLKKDYPAIAARVERGEISCHAGCIEAGFRKAPAKRRDWTKAEAYA